MEGRCYLSYVENTKGTRALYYQWQNRNKHCYVNPLTNVGRRMHMRKIKEISAMFFICCFPSLHRRALVAHTFYTEYIGIFCLKCFRGKGEKRENQGIGRNAVQIWGTWLWPGTDVTLLKERRMSLFRRYLLKSATNDKHLPPKRLWQKRNAKVKANDMFKDSEQRRTDLENILVLV